MKELGIMLLICTGMGAAVGLVAVALDEEDPPPGVNIKVETGVACDLDPAGDVIYVNCYRTDAR